MRTTVSAVTGLAFVAALTGCTAAGNGVQATPAASSVSSVPTTSPLSPSGSPVEVTQAQLTSITEDLATRGVNGDISVVSAYAVTWTDGSLGCPESGRMYPQVLTSGFQVIVSVAGKSYDYRFGAGAPRLCT
jgi:hypothetical protein